MGSKLLGLENLRHHGGILSLFKSNTELGRIQQVFFPSITNSLAILSSTLKAGKSVGKTVPETIVKVTSPVLLTSFCQIDFQPIFVGEYNKMTQITDTFEDWWDELELDFLNPGRHQTLPSFKEPQVEEKDQFHPCQNCRSSTLYVPTTTTHPLW